MIYSIFPSQGGFRDTPNEGEVGSYHIFFLWILIFYDLKTSDHEKSYMR